ncbi:MAG: UDP-N-acetylglucosamine--N-acetylmuramyl-(pentapeptide) pyrophosphoryl-undecaprenol N-acetylglucosamine transferase [Holophagaceae bacterium]|nr:UDP-N-acetylglucosamine--N-acetylmuramyl-(pentapeptide) pyrophosphoryl-undecaprenol N-acetylglucosamine transferase [Holophagaceae bacterium]
MDINFTDSLVFTGGGTGGHFYPAVALAEAAQLKWPDRSIVFVGAKEGIESRLLPKSNWQYLLLDVDGLSRSPIRALRALWRMYSARNFLISIWKVQRPLAVIGTGGYGAGAALYAAKSLGIPYFIHESNAAPGLIVRLTAKNAKAVWLGMSAAKTLLPGANCAYVGTPVRSPFLRSFASIKTLFPPHRLLVLGGSGGARAINSAVFSIGEKLLERQSDWEIFHQVGHKEIESCSKLPRHPRHTIVPYIENMDIVMESASLVISRSGASTCAELLVAGRPTVMVPLPTSAGDHQRHNAIAFTNENHGQMVEQGQGFDERLFSALSAMMSDSKLRESMSKPSANLAVEKCLNSLSHFQSHLGF